MTSLYPVHLRHAQYYLTVLRQANSLYQKGGDDLKQALQLVQLESPNIQIARAWAEMHAGNDDRAALVCSDYQVLGAYLFDLTQHPSQRKSWLEVALASARQLHDRAAEGRHLNNLGMACDELGEHKDAIALYEQRLIIAREMGDLAAEAQTQGNLGVSYKNSGDPVRAIECFEEQLSIAKRLNDARGEANALCGLGIAHARLAHAARAAEYQQRSLEIHRQIGDRRGEGNATGNLAGAYFLMGELDRAIDLYHQRLGIARELQDRHGEANALWGIGLVSNEKGVRANAVEHVQAALRIFEELRAPSAGRIRKLLMEWGVEGS